MATSDRSIANVLQDILRNIQEIVRSEVRLAKAEVREEVGKAKSAGALVGAAAICGIFSSFFLLLTIIYALTRVMPDWAAALTITVILAIVAGVLFSAGAKRFKQVHPAPDRTIETVKENVEWAKQQTK